MHANGRLWYYLFGKDIGCALLCRIFRILKRILVWNWQLLKQARIRSWKAGQHAGRTDGRLPEKIAPLRRTSEWMRRTYVMDLCPNTFWRVSSSIPWVWPERQMRGVRCAGWPRPGVAFPAYDSKTEPHGIVFTYRKDTFGESFFHPYPIFFNQFDSNGQ